MIHRSRQETAVPISLTQQDCNDCLSDVVAGVNNGLVANNVNIIKSSKDLISPKYYRGNQLGENGISVQDVEVALKDLYGEKCAFCESKRTHPDVEHYRPKKRVTGEQGHQGYYWLCYEWTNLLPSCPDCNKVKLNQFPLLPGGIRVYSPTYQLSGEIEIASMAITNIPLAAELPYLLHPEVDSPELFLVFRPSGKIYGTDQNGRGNETIRICDLNRKDLIFFRQKEINLIAEMLEMALCTADPDYMFISVLNKVRSRALTLDNEYTLLYLNAYNHFCDMIVPILPPACQYRAEELYHQNVNPI